MQINYIIKQNTQDEKTSKQTNKIQKIMKKKAREGFFNVLKRNQTS